MNDRRETGRLRAHAVADLIRADILAGVLPPGQRLTFPGLCAQHAVSVGVLREALVRLVYRGIVQTESNLGFRVLELSPERFAEHVLLRSLIEPQFVRHSVAHGSVEWESDLIAAHHLLERTTMFEAAEPAPSMAWNAAHTRFHLALVAAGHNPRVVEITERFHDVTCMYRRWSTSNDAPDAWEQKMKDEHRALLDAALSRDPDAAAQRSEEHIQRAVAAITVVDAYDGPRPAVGT